ncbi:MAG: hypothetical protein L0Z49_00870 [Actinobacteria bacterium]|nr:hypothetical protein [Actinomycetota bacterium]
MDLETVVLAEGETFDASSFETFCAEQRRSLVALAYAMSGSRQTAEDLAQDALVAAYRN